MSYLIIDLETTVKNTIGNNKGSAVNPENYIVLCGSKKQGCFIETLPILDSINLFSNVDLLIGHNIKFDLLYLLRDPYFKKVVWPNIKIWDTSLAEYLISGQSHVMPSLDECSEKYGGTLKDSRVKDLWNSGVQTEDIPKDLLEEYLKHDVTNTELVYLEQNAIINTLGMLPLVTSQMQSLKATTEMEMHGLKTNVATLKSLQTTCEKQITDIEGKIRQQVYELHPTLKKLIDLNIGSNHLISKIIYGGTVVHAYKVEVGMYKTGLKKGTIKFQTKEEDIVLPPLVAPNKKDQTKTEGIYQVGEDSIKKLCLSKLVNSKVKSFLTDLLVFRGLVKELNTYIMPLYGFIYSHDQCVHGNFNHAVTITGRLSSSNPNMQNFSTGDS